MADGTHTAAPTRGDHTNKPLTADDVLARSAMKLSEGAKDVLDYLIDNSIGEGIVSGDGECKPEHLALGICTIFNFEENYDAPNGVAVVPNDFLPSSTGESMTLAVGRATTAGDYLKQNVVSVAALLNVLYVEMTALARSLINFHVDEAT